jgi:hypothetical protein
MKAVNFEEIKIGNKILVDLKNLSGDHNYTILEVTDIDKEEHSIVSNLDGGIDIYPNEDDKYILVDYEGED